MVRHIELSRNQVAIIDDDDLGLVAGRWRAVLRPSLSGVVRYVAQRHRPVGSDPLFHIQMHRLVIDAPHGALVDHINGDTLDNRRSNLRLATHSENQANRHTKNRGTSSKFKGVTWHRECCKWQATVKVNGRSLYLGLFDSEAEAAAAYNDAARNVFGEFAFLNKVAA